jgi:hypothetical protein
VAASAPAAMCVRAVCAVVVPSEASSPVSAPKVSTQLPGADARRAHELREAVDERRRFAELFVHTRCAGAVWIGAGSPAPSYVPGSARQL